MALEPGRDAIEYRLPGPREAVADALETVFHPAGELLRQMDLIGAEHIDDVMRIARKHRHAVGLGAQAPEHQGRVQRDRVEGAGRQSQEGAIGQARGDHGDPGGELGQGLAKMRGVELACLGARKACVHRKSGKAVRHAAPHRRDGPWQACKVVYDNGYRRVLPSAATMRRPGCPRPGAF